MNLGGTPHEILLQYLSSMEAEGHRDEGAVETFPKEQIQEENKCRTTVSDIQTNAKDQPKSATSLYVCRPYSHRISTSIPVKFYNPARETEAHSSDSFMKTIQSPVKSASVPLPCSTSIVLNGHQFSKNVETESNLDKPLTVQFPVNNAELQNAESISENTEDANAVHSFKSSDVKNF